MADAEQLQDTLTDAIASLGKQAAETGRSAPSNALNLAQAAQALATAYKELNF